MSCTSEAQCPSSSRAKGVRQTMLQPEVPHNWASFSVYARAWKTWNPFRKMEGTSSNQFQCSPATDCKNPSLVHLQSKYSFSLMDSCLLICFSGQTKLKECQVIHVLRVIICKLNDFVDINSNTFIKLCLYLGRCKWAFICLRTNDLAFERNSQNIKRANKYEVYASCQPS